MYKVFLLPKLWAEVRVVVVFHFVSSICWFLGGIVTDLHGLYGRERKIDQVQLRSRIETWFLYAARDIEVLFVSVRSRE